VTTVNTANDYRDKTLKGEDFFNVSKYPRIIFKSTSVKKSASGYEVFGSLTIAGVTKLVILEAESPAAPEIALVHAGKVLSIGVSNFNRALLQAAVELSDIPLATNQFEYHPYLNQASLVTATREAGAAVTAYCAMAVGRVVSEPVLQGIAKRHSKSVSQIVLRWLVQQKNVVALSRTEREERIRENLNIFDFVLEEGDMNAIFRRAQEGSRIVDPPGLSPLWDPTPPAPVIVRGH